MRKFLMAAVAAMVALPVWAQAPQPASPARAPAATARPVEAPRPAAAAAKVDINGATVQQLENLPGIGPARSKAILAARPYAELDELVKKKVLTPAVFNQVKPGMALANINTSTAAEMEKTLPGIGDVRSKAIVAGRPYAGPQDLVGKGVLTQPQLDRIKDLIAS